MEFPERRGKKGEEEKGLGREKGKGKENGKLLKWEIERGKGEAEKKEEERGT